MVSLHLEELYSWLEKTRVYLQPGEKPPEGVAVNTGKRGGKYYISKPRLEKIVDKAPIGLKDFEKRQKEAEQRIKEWKSGKYLIPRSDEEIIMEGYQWRKWAHEKNTPWDWAVWEEIQRLANLYGYKYKDKLTEKDILDNPFLPDVDKLLGDELESDDVITDYRNRNNKHQLFKFIKSENGKRWRVRSLRDLWKQIKIMPKDKVLEFYPDFIKLKYAKSWDEAINIEVTVYRGILGKKEDAYKAPIISYTTCPKVAEKFARGYLYSYDKGSDAGIVVKRKSKFEDLLGYLNPDGENEVILPLPSELQKEKLCQ